ncbi:hypothetical protein [Thermoactinomyces sp. DSM 45892]|uniref:hypothetical protein n=1 Tax=Thermoactinomyces sp. DSM 45892 TaxID=1882753 RepID=UPI00089660E3|nr:hypothetical protein [Thermoactinomyces sp. DSM 45892]SDY23623.1 hypothetical protein SAMN05444416_10355 [Thermoactinomyces sp. DSM 45892]
MLKLRLEGPDKQIDAFLYELDRNPSVEIHESKDDCEIQNGEISSYSQCSISHAPQERVDIIEMETVDGLIIRLPLLDVMRVRIGDDVTFFCGKSYDIFADNKKGHRTWPE